MASSSSFDTEIAAQGIRRRLRIREIPIATQYFPEAPQIGVPRSVRYELSILWLLARDKLRATGAIRSPLFDAAGVNG